MLKLRRPDLLRDSPYINGQWCEDLPAALPVRNPANGEDLLLCKVAGTAEAEQAVAAAAEAQLAWRQKTAKERSQILRRWYELMLVHAEDLALILTAEQGKPLAEAQGEIGLAANFIEWFAEEAKRVYGDIVPANGSHQRMLVSKQPVGVVAAITPWNFPAAMVTRKAAPALAVGCTVVLKPAPDTPLSALALAVLAEEAGIPAGVLNVLPGDAQAIGGVLTSSPVVRKLSFTGSTAVGKLLLRQCADTVKRTSMELGGNAPFLVFDDADLEQAVAGVMLAKFRNTGQTCICANRILVQRGVYQAFADKLYETMAAMPVGDGMEPGVVLGPLINSAAANKVRGLVDDAVAKGANLREHPNVPEGECFVRPAVVDKLSADMAISQAEIFGPIAALQVFDSEAEAIAMANDTRMGLAAYSYTQDYRRMARLVDALEYGMQGFNESALTNEGLPFGGVKESGLGREGSKYGIEEYLDIKTATIGGID